MDNVLDYSGDSSSDNVVHQVAELLQNAGTEYLCPVLSQMSKHWTRASKSSKPPASSSSELEIVLLGLESVTMLSMMSWGHLRRQRMGRLSNPRLAGKCGDGNQTPPAPNVPLLITAKEPTLQSGWDKKRYLG